MPRLIGFFDKIGDDIMLYEKSCGAVVFRDDTAPDGQTKKYVLMIKQSESSRFSFPKGHVESGESETDTAEREVLEETSVRIKISDGFRRVVCYSPKPGVRKQVVYFVALTDVREVCPRDGEIFDVKWIDAKKASGLLGHSNDRRVLSMALEYIRKKGK